MNTALAALDDSTSYSGLFGGLVYAVGFVVAIAWIVLPFTISRAVNKMNRTLQRIEDNVERVRLTLKATAEGAPDVSQATSILGAIQDANSHLGELRRELSER